MHKPSKGLRLFQAFLLVTFLLFAVVLTVAMAVKIPSAVVTYSNTTTVTEIHTDTLTVEGLRFVRVSKVTSDIYKDDPSTARVTSSSIQSLAITNTGEVPMYIRTIGYAYRGAEITYRVEKLEPGQRITPLVCTNLESFSGCNRAYYITTTAGALVGFVPNHFVPDESVKTPATE